MDPQTISTTKQTEESDSTRRETETGVLFSKMCAFKPGVDCSSRSTNTATSLARERQVGAGNSKIVCNQCGCGTRVPVVVEECFLQVLFYCSVECYVVAKHTDNKH